MHNLRFEIVMHSHFLNQQGATLGKKYSYFSIFPILWMRFELFKKFKNVPEQGTLTESWMRLNFLAA